MIPAEDYANAEPGDRAWRAVCRALALRPRVIKLWPIVSGTQMFRVERSDRLSCYPVELYKDRDGQVFIHCYCQAGNPMVDFRTQLPGYAPRPCFHAASVIIEEAKEYGTQTPI